MAIKFEFYESPNTIGTRKKRYHARVVNWQRINTDYLAREIQYGSSLTHFWNIFCFTATGSSPLRK